MILYRLSSYFVIIFNIYGKLSVCQRAFGGFLARSLSSCSSLLFSSGCGSQRRQGKSAHTAERPAVTEHDRRSTQKECVCLDASVQTPAE